MFKFFGGIFAGATYHFKALALLIRTPQLHSYVLIPVVLNFLLGIAVYIGLLIPGIRGIDGFISNLALPSWASAGGIILPIVEWVLYLLLGLGLLISTGFLLVQFGVILGAPWYGRLSEELEKIRLGQSPPTEVISLTSIVRDISRALTHELKKLLLLIFIGLPLFVLGFIPPFGTAIASIGGIALSATLLCLDFFDAPLERRRLRFRTKLQLIVRNLPASGIFGLFCLFLVSIPLLNLLSIPLCVTAGTLFFCDRLIKFTS